MYLLTCRDLVIIEHECMHSMLSIFTKYPCFKLVSREYDPTIRRQQHAMHIAQICNECLGSSKVIGHSNFAVTLVSCDLLFLALKYKNCKSTKEVKSCINKWNVSNGPNFGEIIKKVQGGGPWKSSLYPLICTVYPFYHHSIPSPMCYLYYLLQHFGTHACEYHIGTLGNYTTWISAWLECSIHKQKNMYSKNNLFIGVTWWTN